METVSDPTCSPEHHDHDVHLDMSSASPGSSPSVSSSAPIAQWHAGMQPSAHPPAQWRWHILKELCRGRRERVLRNLSSGTGNADSATGVGGIKHEIALLTTKLKRNPSTAHLSLQDEAALIAAAADRRATSRLSSSTTSSRHLSTEDHLGSALTSPVDSAGESDLEEAAASAPRLHFPGGSSSRLIDDPQLVQLFLESLGSTLFVAGLPAHMVHYYLVLLANHFHIRIRISDVYNGFVCQLNDDAHCRLIQGNPLNMSLSKICDICECTEAILHGQITPVEGLARLESILSRPSFHSVLVTIVATACFDAAYAPLFNGGWSEMLIAFVSGIFGGIFDAFSPGHATLERGHDMLCALTTTTLAVLWHSYIAELNLMAAILPGICWALPGLRLTLAVVDISTGHPLNGIAQFVGGALTLAHLGIGIAGGLHLLSWTRGTNDIFAPHDESPFALWTFPLFGLASTFPCVVLFDASWSHWPQLLLGTTVAFLGSTWLPSILGIGPGTWLSALALGLVANAYGRLTRWPGLEITMFSVLILLPGAIGVQGMLAEDSTSTITFLLQMMVIVLAIITGLLTANFILKPDASV